MTTNLILHDDQYRAQLVQRYEDIQQQLQRRFYAYDLQTQNDAIVVVNHDDEKDLFQDHVPKIVIYIQHPDDTFSKHVAYVIRLNRETDWTLAQAFPQLSEIRVMEKEEQHVLDLATMRLSFVVDVHLIARLRGE